MKYINRKIGKRTEARASASAFTSILVRVVVLAVLLFGMVQGCNYVVNAIHNAPVAEWKLRELRNENLKALIHARTDKLITEEQFKSQVAYWNDSLNVLREYREGR